MYTAKLPHFVTVIRLFVCINWHFCLHYHDHIISYDISLKEYWKPLMPFPFFVMEFYSFWYRKLYKHYVSVQSLLFCKNVLQSTSCNSFNHLPTPNYAEPEICYFIYISKIIIPSSISSDQHARYQQSIRGCSLQSVQKAGRKALNEAAKERKLSQKQS